MQDFDFDGFLPNEDTLDDGFDVDELAWGFHEIDPETELALAD